jgi:hypothetical protein
MANDHIADDRKKVRLIDANAYPCQTCEVSYCYKNCEKFNAWFNKTVDAVEVRCGECRFVDTDACPMSGTPGRVSASDFCSYGERRTNA